MPSHPLNGFDFHYADAGQGTPVVLVHGFPVDGRVWEDVGALLAGKGRVIVPELRGFGKSVSDVAFSIESLADDLHGLLSELGALPCALAGLSMGGYVALAFAEKYPTDLVGLILTDTKSAADTPEQKEKRNDLIRLVRTGGPAAVAAKMMPDLLAPENATLAGPRLGGMILDTPALTIEHALAAMRDRADYTGLLATLAVPSLVIVGLHDPLAPPALAQGMVAQLKQVQYAEIDRAGHMSPLEQPALVARAIGAFLARV